MGTRHGTLRSSAYESVPDVGNRAVEVDGDRSGEAIWHLLDAAPEAIVMTDDDGVVRVANRVAHDLFGGFPGELLGRLLTEFVVDRRGPATPPPGELGGAGEFGQPGEPGGPGASRWPWVPAPAFSARRRCTGLRSDGTEVELEMSASPGFTELGEWTVMILRPWPGPEDAVTARPADDPGTGHGPDRVIDPADRPTVAESYDRAVNRIFAAGLELDVVRRSLGSAIAARIDTAIDVLDGALRDLRAAALAVVPPTGRSRRPGSSIEG